MPFSEFIIYVVSSPFMLKPIRWKTFVRDMAIIQIGFALFGISIAMIIRANLGVAAWSVLDVALSQITLRTPGTMTVLVGFVVLAVSMLLHEQVGWGTLANILSIGPWEDLFLYLIPSIKNNLALQVTMLLSAILIQRNRECNLYRRGSGRRATRQFDAGYQTHHRISRRMGARNHRIKRGPARMAARWASGNRHIGFRFINRTCSAIVVQSISCPSARTDCRRRRHGLKNLLHRYDYIFVLELNKEQKNETIANLTPHFSKRVCRSSNFRSRMGIC